MMTRVHLSIISIIRRRSLCAVALASALAVLTACGSDGRLPPVFGAVFGLEGAASAPYRIGRVPEPVAGPGDRIIGLAAGNPGQCIFADSGGGRRFRAACPEGFEL